MVFILAAVVVLLQAITLFTVLWLYRQHRHCVPVKEYSQLADCYLDALVAVVNANIRRNSYDEIDPLS